MELFGFIGKDGEGKQLKELVKESKIKTSGIVSDTKRNTTTKTRIIAENQQVVRIDKENANNPEAAIENNLITKIKASINRNNIGAVIFSDYNKGVISKKIVSEITKLARRKKIFAIADPKGDDLTKYKGVNALTPNLKEASELCGYKISQSKEVNKAAKQMIETLKLDGVLLTRGRDGISYRLSSSNLKTVSSDAKEVFDVTGAGDTVISAFLVSYLLSNNWETAISTANSAAGIVVGQVGTSSISQDELIQLLSGAKNENSKTLDIDSLGKQVFEHKKKGKKIIFTNGCFDLLHPGHLMILKESKALGDILIVALNSDSSVRRLKGKSRPLISETERASIISSLDCVDYVTIFSEDTPLKTIKQLTPDVIVKGGDYSRDQVIGRGHVEKYGGEVVIIPVLENFSTTSLVEKIKRS
ncbi:MAG: D-glycero-beta-D-manno-heptose 1-phosphate adenylyltransferase [Candidatus Dadabacteria bacterium]|nr:D-glycero-beta-D-manno-heptose 1-phosphate adenylyltransferase [Candidatus Dadabacteria bacterium]NIS09152.1 D-glycero-beta-D-manno-heptose 1-phosphate adenylyltransferase [Candidatus Dadabacteria bacterium]NIY22459.1 D-glycero-beta-D-manno-heptose 1-phosphate adenylyltransferase [Candidatus Dadabacteria bacterium]